jgi:leader peptidase (prepilin peptidase) / N-methyltransferase
MIFSIIAVIIVGVIAGGIVNALADDLPYYRLLRLPHYPDGSPRPVSAWLGISAFITGQRTSPGGAALSWRYPLAEISTVIGMILSVMVRYARMDVSDVQLVFWLFYMAVFVLITVVDLEHRLILFSVIIPSAVIAILDAIITPVQRDPDLGRALLGGALGFGVFFVMYIGGVLYVYVSNASGRNITEVAFGYGDVMMATLSGLILGLEATILAIFITIFLGALGALIWLVAKRLSGSGYSRFAALPYGPYIVAGTFIMLLFSSQVRLFMVGY